MKIKNNKTTIVHNQLSNLKIIFQKHLPNSLLTEKRMKIKFKELYHNNNTNNTNNIIHFYNNFKKNKKLMNFGNK